MFYYLANSPFGFWAVAFSLVMFDSVVFLNPSQFTFTFGSRLVVKLRIVENPFLLRHKQTIITLLVHPITPFFIASVDEPSRGRRGAQRILLQQKRISVCSRQLANLSLLMLVLLVVVGPIASLQYGVDRALLMIVPALYACAILGAVMVWANRTTFGFNSREASHIFFELAVCPVLMINILKRIALRQTRLCVADLLEYFTKNRSVEMRRLERHLEATVE